MCMWLKINVTADNPVFWKCNCIPFSSTGGMLQSVSHETKQKVKRRMDLEMKITVARFIFIEKPLFLSSAPKKKRGFKKKMDVWRD